VCRSSRSAKCFIRDVNALRAAVVIGMSAIPLTIFESGKWTIPFMRSTCGSHANIVRRTTRVLGLSNGRLQIRSFGWGNAVVLLRYIIGSAATWAAKTKGVWLAEIVLINPRFESSYWGLEHALPVFGVKANLPAACLPLLAALTPDSHSVTLMDENVQPIDFDVCARADIVGLTGMIVQRFRMKEILTELKIRGCFVVVGGPWVTVQEDYFGELTDAVFVGEAEET